MAPMPRHRPVMRSALGRVRGLGPARAGAHHWQAERISALALVPLTLWFVGSVLARLGADQPAVAGWIARPWNAALLLALIALTFQHAVLGLQVVYEDYIHRKAVLATAILLTRFLALLLGLAAAVAVLKLAVTAPH